MSPPGKNSGETTKLSVENASRPASRSNVAWSLSARSSSLSKAGRKRVSISSAVARPPAPCVRSTTPSGARTPLLAQLGRRAVVRVGRRTRALGRDPAPPDRVARRAGRAEQRAVDRLVRAAQDLRTQARGMVLAARVHEREAPLGVVVAVGRTQPQRAERDRAQAAPLERLAQLEDLGDQLLRLDVAA